MGPPPMKLRHVVSAVFHLGMGQQQGVKGVKTPDIHYYLRRAKRLRPNVDYKTSLKEAVKEGFLRVKNKMFYPAVTKNLTTAAPSVAELKRRKNRSMMKRRPARRRSTLSHRRRRQSLMKRRRGKSGWKRGLNSSLTRKRPLTRRRASRKRHYLRSKFLLARRLRKASRKHRGIRRVYVSNVLTAARRRRSLRRGKSVSRRQPRRSTKSKSHRRRRPRSQKIRSFDRDMQLNLVSENLAEREPPKQASEHQQLPQP